MGATYVTASVTGTSGSRSYEFLVDTGSTFIGLPQVEIDELGLERLGDRTVRLVTADGIVDREIYYGFGDLQGEPFVQRVLAMPTPVIGYELLQTLRFRVNTVSHVIERVPDDEVHPPFAL